MIFSRKAGENETILIPAFTEASLLAIRGKLYHFNFSSQLVDCFVFLSVVKNGKSLRSGKTKGF